MQSRALTPMPNESARDASQQNIPENYFILAHLGHLAHLGLLRGRDR